MWLPASCLAGGRRRFFQEPGASGSSGGRKRHRLSAGGKRRIGAAARAPGQACGAHWRSARRGYCSADLQRRQSYHAARPSRRQNGKIERLRSIFRRRIYGFAWEHGRAIRPIRRCFKLVCRRKPHGDSRSIGSFTGSCFTGHSFSCCSSIGAARRARVLPSHRALLRADFRGIEIAPRAAAGKAVRCL